MVVHPLTTVSHAITPSTIGIATLLVATTGGLCLLAPRWLVVAVPSVALNLFSWYDLQQTIDYHYWIVPVGAVALAGAVGAGAVDHAATRHLGADRGLGRRRSRSPLVAVDECDHRADPVRVAEAGRPPGRVRGDPEWGAGLGTDARALAPLRAQVALRSPGAFHPGAGGHGMGRGGAGARRSRSSTTSSVDPGLKAWGSHTDEEIEQAIADNGFREVMRRGETRLYHREPG